MTVLGFGHPSRRRLADWFRSVDGGDEAIAGHVDTCERCAEYVITLDDDVDSDAVDDQLADAIRQIYTPPPDLNERVMESIDESERTSRDLNLFIGLFGIAGDAAELVLGDAPPANPQVSRPGPTTYRRGADERSAPEEGTR